MAIEAPPRFSSLRLNALDAHLLLVRDRPGLSGIFRFFLEFLYFGLKEARACLFVGLFFAAVFLVPRSGLWGIPRYDALLAIALGHRAGDPGLDGLGQARNPG